MAIISLASFSALCITLIALALQWDKRVVEEWQPQWYEVFSKIGNVSDKVNELNETTKKAVATMNNMDTEMRDMNTHIDGIEIEFQLLHKDMNAQLSQMNTSVYNLSHSVPYGMSRIRSKMNIGNMMPFP